MLPYADTVTCLPNGFSPCKASAQLCMGAFVVPETHHLQILFHAQNTNGRTASIPYTDALRRLWCLQASLISCLSFCQVKSFAYLNDCVKCINPYMHILKFLSDCYFIPNCTSCRFVRQECRTEALWAVWPVIGNTT
jgi:hypothetical protein